MTTTWIESVKPRFNHIPARINTIAGDLVGVGTIAIVDLGACLGLQVIHHIVLQAVATGKQMYLLFALIQADAELHTTIGQRGHFHYPQLHAH